MRAAREQGTKEDTEPTNTTLQWCAGHTGGEESANARGPLEEGTATHSRTLAWRIPWAEEPGGSQFIGSQRVRCD